MAELDLEALRANLEAVRERLSRAAQRSGRNPEAIRLLAVTKTLPLGAVELARRAGLKLFGENRVQEAEEKYASMAGEVELHLIGHLQRNKAGKAAGLFACIQSIDRVETAQALNRCCAQRGRTLPILLEMNTSGEASKSGFRSLEELLEAAERIAELELLSIRGLMTVGPLSADGEEVRRAFALLRRSYGRLQERCPSLALDTLSMGMSGDFEIAIEEGATLVRVGTALFGARS